MANLGGDGILTSECPIAGYANSSPATGG